jgi:hypothetical protein
MFLIYSTRFGSTWQLSLGIKKEIRDSNTLLDHMESGVAMTGGMLKVTPSYGPHTS